MADDPKATGMPDGGYSTRAPRTKVLVADIPENEDRMRRILAGHELSCPDTLEKAEQLLRERTFDLIVCTVFFDESHLACADRAAERLAVYERARMFGLSASHDLRIDGKDFRGEQIFGPVRLRG